MEEIREKIKFLVRKKKSLIEICKELDLSQQEVIGIVTLMKEDGELVDYVKGEIIRIKKLVVSGEETFVRDDAKVIKMILISDTHMGSKAERQDVIKYLYGYADENDIKYVLHSGDLTDGYYPNRPQQVYELKKHGYDEQLDHVVSKYPRFNGKTYFVTGNHDFTHIRNGGGDIGRAIAREREDMVYLGADQGDLTINKLKIHMYHGAGGRAYAKGYKLQRYAETLTPGKYDILTRGHSHDALYMYYLDMHCFQCGALVNETQFSRMLGLKNEISAWIVKAYLDQKGKPYAIEQRQEVFTKKRVKSK